MLAVMAVQGVQVLVQILVVALAVVLVLADALNQLQVVQRHAVEVAEKIVVDYVKLPVQQNVLVVQELVQAIAVELVKLLVTQNAQVLVKVAV